MLDDREQKLLVEIERRLLLEDPELVRSFAAPPPHPAHGHQHRAAAATAAGLTLCAVLWRGPRPLTADEVTTRAKAGPPRVAPTSRAAAAGAAALPVPRGPLPHETRGRT